MSAVDDGYKLTDKDVPLLVEILTPVRHKWKEIAIALKLPSYVWEECRMDKHVIALTSVLNEWIQGNGDEIITLGSLRKVLAGPIVMHRVLADKLIPEFNKARRKDEQPVTSDDSEGTDLAGIARRKANQEGKQDVVESPTFITNPVHQERNQSKAEDVKETTDLKVIVMEKNNFGLMSDLKQKTAACCKSYGLVFLTVAVPILAILFIVMLSTSSPLDIPPPTEPPAKSLLLDSKPAMQDLLFLRCGSEELEIITEVAPMCNTLFGYLLNLDSPTVNIELDVPGKHAHSKCQNIMLRWLDAKEKDGKPVTWKTLVEALRRFGKNWLAVSLEKCIR